uniref:G protein-coupled receptor 144 n=1 Tax=Nothobranchius korthausae TaxID=1143690 RepID=A0A1A8FQX3_9TELE
MKELSESQSSQPSAFMNQLIKFSNMSQPVLGQQPSGINNLTQAMVLLNISVQALEETQEELQPEDMVSLVQLLSLTSDVPSEPSVHSENSSNEKIQELSQHFISVADSIIKAGGWWNTKGCEVVSKHQAFTVCYCNHTTNFALLLQVYEAQRSPENEKALQVLTFIGCGVSLCGLLFTFILFVAVGVPKSDRTTVHKNLIGALGVAELLLMCSDWAAENQAACFVVTALLHLFFMASFSWMLVEGLLLWSKVVSVNISEDRRMKLYYVIGWGLPVLIVAVTLAVSADKYKADHHCWLSVKTDTIWAFVGPVIFVLAVNAVVLCRVVMVTVSSANRRAKMLSPSSASKMQTFDLTWAVTRPVLILLPVLGLTWLCGVLVHLSVVLAYGFIVLNSFQGLYIFLRAPVTSWNCRQPTPSSPETSETSGPTSSTSTSLVIKNESFRKESFVSFSLKQASRNQEVQLTGFKPSGC